MKKKIFAVILAVLCLGAGIIGAAQLITDSMQAQETELDTDSKEAVYYTYDQQAVYAKPLSDSAESAVFAKLDQSGLEQNEVYDSIFEYKRFLKVYHPSAEAINYINSLIDQGADVRVLVELYDFWTTTNEPITIIGEMYDLSGVYTGDYWKENAFDTATQNRHGVLDVEGVKQYLSSGVSREDIAAASILCRKGVYTITEILDKLIAGETWANIIAQHGASQNPVAALAVTGQPAQAQAIESSSLTDNPVDLLNCLRFAELSGQDVNTCLSSIEDHDALLEAYNQFGNEVQTEIIRELEQDEIYKTVITEEEEVQ